MRLGILGCSEIAFRRFMPALQNVNGIEAVAVAEEYAPQKLTEFTESYPMDAETSFEKLIHRADIDAIYVPQPPALHHKYAKMALEAGKHVLIEKPSTTNYADSKELVDIAREKGLALHENYMFQYHSQIREIQKLISDGVIGEVRLIRANFGFPMRAQNDFRYNASLGGGALLDACGYPIKLATLLLGETTTVTTSAMQMMPGYEVDMFGSVSLTNADHVVCQIGYGMDCHYQCNLTVWGSKGQLYTNRIFTAPPNYEPIVVVETAEENKEIRLEADSHFEHSIEAFYHEVNDVDARVKMYDSILLQANLIEQVRTKNTAK